MAQKHDTHLDHRTRLPRFFLDYIYELCNQTGYSTPASVSVNKEFTPEGRIFVGCFHPLYRDDSGNVVPYITLIFDKNGKFIQLDKDGTSGSLCL